MRHTLLLVMVLAIGGCDHAPRSSPQPPPQAKAGSDAVRSKLEVIMDLEHVREGRIARLETCTPEDWPELVLMAVDRYDWSDDLAIRKRRAVQDVQCKALSALDTRLWLFSTQRNLLLRRRAATALSRPEILAALDDAIRGKVPLGPGCTSDDFARLVEYVPLHPLRPSIEAYASERIRDDLLAALDRDLDYHPGPRIEQLERWASEITPAGFEHVLEALAPGYAWNDGAPPPTAAEQKTIDDHAADLITWLLWLSRSPRFVDCKLGDPVAHGRLGALVLARLDHPNPLIRKAILEFLSIKLVDGSRARVAEIEDTDPDPSVREAASGTKSWIDRGGKGKQEFEEMEQFLRRTRPPTPPTPTP